MLTREPQAPATDPVRGERRRTAWWVIGGSLVLLLGVFAYLYGPQTV